MEDMSASQGRYTSEPPTDIQPEPSPTAGPTAGPTRPPSTPDEIQLRQAQLELGRNEFPPRTEWERIIENSILRVVILVVFSFSGVLFMIFVAWVGNVVFGTCA